MEITRSVRAAISGEWVTTTTVYALLPVEADEHVDNLLAGAAVQVAGGFVGEEDGGFLDEGAGDADALLLAAGEFGGLVAHPVAEADALQGFPGALAAGLRRPRP